MPEDFLNKIHSQIRARLRELDGVHAEYDQLLAAADALGASAGGASTARRTSSARPRRGRPRRSTTTASTAAPAEPSTAAAPRRRPRRPATTGAARTTRRTGSAARKRAPRGANRDAVLAALRAKPGGASARELATSAGVGRVSTYQVLGRLESERLVNRADRGDGPALYTLR